VEARRAKALVGLHARLEDLLLLGERRRQCGLTRLGGGQFLAKVVGGAVGGDGEGLGVCRSRRQLEAELDVRLRDAWFASSGSSRLRSSCARRPVPNSFFLVSFVSLSGAIVFS
jgi:hypothetical protein